VEQRADGRENPRAFDQGFVPVIGALERVYQQLFLGKENAEQGYPRKSRWLRRLLAAEGEGRLALERLYGAGVDPGEVLEILVHTRFTIGAARRLSPSGARRAAAALQVLRPVFEAVEQSPPCQITFKAMAGDDNRFTITWSFAEFNSTWLPRYLEACADQGATSSLIVTSRLSDRALRRCADALDRLIRERTGRPGDADLGALLHAAFPRHFHRRAADGDDHAEAARSLLRRARAPR
jgi:hypothetical protein